MKIITSQTGYRASTSALLDSDTAINTKYFTVFDNILDGTFVTIADPPAADTGWWSNVVSDAAGVFSTPVALTIDCEGTYPVHALSLFGNTTRSYRPVDFTIKLYNGTTLLYTETVTNNTSVNWVKKLPVVYVATRAEISITKVNVGNKPVWLSQAKLLNELSRSDTLGITSSTSTIIGTQSSSSDSSILSATESDKITVSISRSDTITISSTDADKGITVSFKKTDAGLVSASESDTLTNSFSKSDSGTVTASEADSITVTQSVSDSGTLAVSESDSIDVNLTVTDTLVITGLYVNQAVTVSFNKSDAGTLSVSEADSLTKQFSSADSGSLSITESSVLVVNVYSQDTGTLGSTETTVSINNLLQSADTGVVIGIEATSITNELYGSDAGTVSVSDATSISVSFKTSDSTTIDSAVDSSIQVLGYIQDSSILDVTEKTISISVGLVRQDTTAVTLLDTKQLTVSDSSIDASSVSIVETRAITVSIKSSDSFTLSVTHDSTTWLYKNSSDTLNLQGGESKNMSNIHNSMNADTRQVFGKVVVTYTDPFNDETIQYSASEIGRFTFLDQLADGVEEPKYKWFSLHDNVLDGSYHPLPEPTEYSVGWWGTQLSGANGVFAIPVEVTVTFSSRSITDMKAVGDSLLNCYPVDFEMKAYNASNQLVYSMPVVGNTNVRWQIRIAPVLAVTRLTLTITKINKPNSVAKLTEMFTAIVEEYSGEIVQGISLFEELGYTTGSLPIGNLSSNETDITLINVARRFDLNNTQSPLYGYVKRNRRVNPYLGAYVGDVIEWHPLGTFWTTSWDIDRHALTVRLTARDRLELLRLTEFSSSILYTNQTLYELFRIILVDAGLTGTEYDIDTALQNITIPYAWFEKMSHRDALQRLAGCAIIQVFCTRDGVIRVNLNMDATTPTPITTYDDDVNVFRAKYPLAVTEQINFVQVSARQWKPGDSEVLYESEETLTVPAGATIERTYEFNSVPVYSIESIDFTSNSPVVVDSYTTYAWGIVVNIKNNGVSAATVTAVSVTGKLLKDTGKQIAIVKDDELIRQDGKIQSNLEHDFIQSLSYAQQLATDIFETFKDATYDVTLDNRGDVVVKITDRVMVNDAFDNVSMPYMVTRQRMDWMGYLTVTTEAKRLKE